MKNDKLFLVWLGESGFPYGLAGIQRSILISKSLVEVGTNVTVISRKGVHTPNSNFKLYKKGVYDGINYIYTSGSPYKPKNFIKRNVLKIIGVINELKLLTLLCKKEKLDVGIISTMQIIPMLRYSIISKCLNFPIILNYVELNSAMTSRNGIIIKINDYLFERFAFNLVDGFLPISDFLVDFVKKHSSEKPFIKIPVLCDFSRFESIQKTDRKKYFIFCGAAGYIEIITFILNAFDLLNTKEEIYLYLVVNGNPNQLSIFNSEIEKIKRRDYIKTFSNLPDKSLAELYVNAAGMLIPLRPTIQDKARFPHKIGEYCASGNPIITTNYGEIKSYFVEGVSALIAEHYDAQEFADKMLYVISNPEKANEIGKNGKCVGLMNFNYQAYGKKIKELILSLKSS